MTREGRDEEADRPMIGRDAHRVGPGWQLRERRCQHIENLPRGAPCGEIKVHVRGLNLCPHHDIAAVAIAANNHPTEG